MIKNWLITNLKKKQNLNSKFIIKNFDNFCLYLDKNTNYYKSYERIIFIEGYILPRYNYYEKYNEIPQEKLIQILFSNHGFDFINYIKGNFNLLIIEQDKFYIFNDRIGVKKFFFFKEGKKFVISNNFKIITKLVDFKIDFENITLNLLINNFIDGLTVVDKIFFSKPATYFKFDKKLFNGSYWNCKELLEIKESEYSISDFSFFFKENIKKYINYLSPNEIYLTLTGGLDSRTILSSLLNLKKKPIIFTYGDKQSGDVNVARKIAKSIGLSYFNPDINLSSEWFSMMANNIIKDGNLLTSIHRAHRYSTVEKIIKNNNFTKAFFGGYMGGEFIRNFSYDGIIVNDFIYNWINIDNDSKRMFLLKDKLSTSYIKENNINIEKLFYILKKQPFSSKFVGINEFYVTFYIIAFAHQSQDVNLFNKFFNYSIPIFMDIDFIENIFTSKYNFMKNIRSRSNIINRAKSHKLYCEIISRLSPEISEIELFKKGSYSPSEYINNNIFQLLVIRSIRLFSEKRKKIKVNFTLDKWMEEYVNQEITELNNSDILREIIDIDKLTNDFQNEKHRTDEKYWRKYSNIIWINKLIQEYL